MLRWSRRALVRPARIRRDQRWEQGHEFLATSHAYGWLGTETLQTRFGDFEFKDGYPVGDAAQRLLDLQKLNRAVEVYTTQLMPVSEIGLREGLRAFGARTPQQVVIWEQLMDARTVLLTANTETVYALAHLNLKADGPTVVEAPPHMLGFLQDGLQRYLADVGPLGADKGNGGKFLVLPPGFNGTPPQGYFVSRSPTYSVTLGLRGFQAEGKTDQAVGLMKQIKIYPLDKAASPPAMQFMNGSKQDIQTVFPDSFRFFELLAMLVEEEPLESFTPFERFQMQAIGIEKGKPFVRTTTPRPFCRRRRGLAARSRAPTPMPRRSRSFLLRRPEMAGCSRRHDLHLHPRRRASDRCPKQCLLHGGRQLAVDDGEERRTGVAVPLDLSGRRRGFPRRLQELQAARPA